jgi:hypothetical protein
MAALARIAPSLPADRLYPRNAAYMARTTLEQTRLTGYQPHNLDTVTTQMMGLLNGHAAVRHRSGVTQETLALFDRAGVHVKEDVRLYESAEEAERHADDLIAEGHKLFWPYPLRERRFPDDAHVVSPSVWKFLNTKQALDWLVPAANLAPRRIARPAELAGSAFERPVFVKVADGVPNGGGFAVRYCADYAGWDGALAWFQARGAEAVVVEEALSVQTCWCAAIAVGVSETTYLGAAEQLFSAPGRQSGSVIDATNLLPPEGATLAVLAGEAARKQGFIGLAGLDIGLTSDARLVVFDPNFRINASTAQVMLHDSAARRGGFSASASVQIVTPVPFSQIFGRLRSPIDDGWFVPTRLVDGALLSTAEGRSMCSGFVLGRNRKSAVSAKGKIERILAG